MWKWFVSLFGNNTQEKVEKGVRIVEVGRVDVDVEMDDGTIHERCFIGEYEATFEGSFGADDWEIVVSANEKFCAWMNSTGKTGFVNLSPENVFVPVHHVKHIVVKRSKHKVEVPT
jgi:hypothetical protein